MKKKDNKKIKEGVDLCSELDDQALEDVVGSGGEGFDNQGGSFICFSVNVHPCGPDNRGRAGYGDET